jgi:uncharacterized membrane protein
MNKLFIIIAVIVAILATAAIINAVQWNMHHDKCNKAMEAVTKELAKNGESNITKLGKLEQQQLVDCP